MDDLIVGEPLVSVIMNCHNCDRYLNEAIDSVYAQTYTNFEIIFFDNASIDSSSLIAKSYDEKIKYFTVSSKLELGEARKLATEHARGKYLAFLDCDDLWYSDKLEKQIKIFETSDDDLGIVYGRSKIIYSDDRCSHVFLEGKNLPEGMVFAEFAKNDFIPFLSAVVDSEKFFRCGGFPAHLKHSTDYWIFAHLTHEYPVAALQDVCCEYRIHLGNLSSTLTNRINGLLESVKVLQIFLPEEDAKIGIDHYNIYMTILHIKNLKVYDAVKVLSYNKIWLVFIKYIIGKVVNILPRFN